MTAPSFLAQLLQSLADQGARASMQQLLLVQVLSVEQRETLYEELYLKYRRNISGPELISALEDVVAKHPIDRLVAAVLAAEGRVDLLEPYLTEANIEEILASAAYRGRLEVLELCMEKLDLSMQELYGAVRSAIRGGQAETLSWLAIQMRGDMVANRRMLELIPWGRADLLRLLANFYPSDERLIKDLRVAILKRDEEPPDVELMEAALDIIETVLWHQKKNEYIRFEAKLVWTLFAKGAFQVLDGLLQRLNMSAVEQAVLIDRVLRDSFITEDHLQYALAKGVRVDAVLARALELGYPEVEQAARELGAQ